ncbi:MAG: hypothetical protein PHX51_08435 [Clostridia bacterium]|nr:hypothetical protein [Clostridia bacterium]
MAENTETTGETKKIFTETDLTLTPVEHAQKATAQVFRDETVDLTARYLKLAAKRVDLMEKLYDNVETLNNDIFNAERFRLLDNKEKLFAMSIHFKAIAALSIPLDEHKNIVNQINVQINNLMKDSNEFKDMPQDKRTLIKQAVEEMLKNIVLAKSDVKILEGDIKNEPKLK